MSNSYKDQHLDRVKYSVRASQAILQYGVGAMVDFQDQTLMTAAPETWENTAIVHDERLEKKLNVTYFRGFNTDREYPTVSYVRFPRWYFCPNCKRFCDIDEWKKIYDKHASKQQKEKDPDMVKRLCCPICKHSIPLVVSRVVTICPEGHIDDFPWIKWAHAKSGKPSCGCNVLELSTTGFVDGMAGASVKCKKCGAWASLNDAFLRGTIENLDIKTNGEYNFKCTGFHPWKNTHEKCSQYPIAIQRGSSAAYFPYVISSLVIPPYSSHATKKIDDSRAFETFFERIKETKADAKEDGKTEDEIKLKIEKRINEYSEKISKETNLDKETVEDVLKRKLEKQPVEDSDVQYRYEEYTALNGTITVKNDIDDDFVREETDIKKYRLPYIKSISLIHKVREVRALKGFTRYEPLEESLDNRDSARIVDIKPENENWYPAYEVRGEGIFIEFDDDAIKAWLRNYPDFISRANTLDEKYKDSFFGKDSTRKISAKFILLHTISHLLIKEMSFSCGYNIASLQERLYCAESKINGVDMQGILIYTAGGDSEGTLGGLVRQGRSDLFPNIFKRAIESSIICSNDPVCSLSHGQGRDSLNYAACYTCALIPETSCEENNVFLDRTAVIGDFDDREKGFYSHQVYSENGWNCNFDTTEKSDEKDDKLHLTLIRDGIELTGMSHYEIFNDLLVDAENAEKHNLEKILQSPELSKCMEFPYEDSEFYVSSYEIDNGVRYNCELMWKKAKVMYFSEGSEEDYNAAKCTNWKCFFGASNNFDINEFIKAIQER